MFDDLMDDMKQARIRELEALILQARQDYYNPPSVPRHNADGTPCEPITDETYDAWVDELSELKVDSPAVTAVGAPPVSAWKKVVHSISMGSLNKVNTLEELTAWVMECVGQRGSAALIVTEKLDGISIHVKYEQGVFSQAITRGDGIKGEDISQNVARMKGILPRLKDNFTGSLRGEIILTKTDHTAHFPEYANTRNAAAGISKRYDGKGCEHLSVKFYRVMEGVDFATEGEQYEWLEAMGFDTPNWYVTAMVPGVKTPHDLWVEYQQTKRAELNYDIDGLVVALNDLAAQLSLGEKDQRPKGAIAFKFAAITRETTLKGIEWQVGGTGRITPVAVFDPVPLMGAMVSNASLYNLKYIQEMKLDIGAKIIVARANDVIPRVVSARVTTGTVAQAPETCPACNAPTARDGEYVVCSNPGSCPAQLVGRIKRYVAGLDIKEWGDTIIERLVQMGLVKDVSDLYRLTQEDLVGVERMGRKSAQKLLDTLHAKNPVPLEILLGSLSIPLCASSTVEMVMSAGYVTWDHIQSAELADFEAVPGLGPVKAQALYDWINHPMGTGRYLMRVLREVGLKIKERVQGTLTGKSFCFTGSMEHKRGELEQMVKDAGGTVKSSVTKGLSYLVMADPSSGSSKAQAARKNGTQCISETDFLLLAGAR